MLLGLPLLSVVVWLPIAASILTLAASSQGAAFARWIALAGSLAGFAVTLPLWQQFDPQIGHMQFEENLRWIAQAGIDYHLGIDGISLLLILLNTFTTLVVVVAGWGVVERRVPLYLASFLMLSGLMNGVFCALDAMLFYVFFEATLIPMFILIGVWGGPNRVYAALKFFLYTLMGSLLMLVALIYLYRLSGGSFSILHWQEIKISYNAQLWIFGALFLAFAVKVPMWPVHTWLPDAHVEAPTGGSVVLAAVMLKLGGYGFLRLSLPIAPDAAHALSGVVVALSLVAVVYIGLVALVQADMKKLIAYSSISHMGFVTMGVFLFNARGVEGAVLQMVSHGFISAAMFLCVGVLYDRMHTRLIADYGGVVNRMPRFAAFMLFFAMANAGLPGTSGFVGEFLVTLGAMQANFWYALIAATTLILGAAYTLWMYKRVIFGEVANEQVAALVDLDRRELLVLSVLALCVLGMGLYPQPFSNLLHSSVTDLLAHLALSKL